MMSKALKKTTNLCDILFEDITGKQEMVEKQPKVDFHLFAQEADR
jgi:hypothetical protein